MTQEIIESPWDTETGLPHDVDGWIVNPKFGFKDEYAQVVKESGGEGAMFLVDLIGENGELIGSQGWSIGTGWIISEDGLEISHPKRKNVVGSSRYGQLQNRVRKELGVPMEKHGPPTSAMSWDKLGFHWLLQEHDVVKGGQKPGLMPVEFLGEWKGALPDVEAPTAARTLTMSDELSKQLTELAKKNDVRAFQLAAVKIAEVGANDELMAEVLDEGPSGYWARAQK